MSDQKLPADDLESGEIAHDSGAFASSPTQHTVIGQPTARELAGASASQSDVLPAGYVLNERYRVQEPLGHGGMGHVYSAYDYNTEREVAIKVLTPTSNRSVEQQRRLFLREAQVMAKLEHRNIVDILDRGHHDSYYYIVMPRLKGEPLSARLQKVGTLSVQLTASIGVDICEAIAAAHSLGIIHRDIKPSNIFLAHDGRETDVVKILDFGIAKLVDPRFPAERATQTGDFAGTKLYAAPEQMRNFKTVDGRADIYSIGLVLYECISGQLPFEGPTPHLLELRPGIAVGLVEAIETALIPDLEKRLSSVELLGQRLRPLVESTNRELNRRRFLRTRFFVLASIVLASVFLAWRFGLSASLLALPHESLTNMAESTASSGDTSGVRIAASPAASAIQYHSVQTAGTERPLPNSIASRNVNSDLPFTSHDASLKRKVKPASRVNGTSSVATETTALPPVPNYVFR